VIRAASPGDGDNLVLAEPQLVAPALDVEPWRPALPPAGQGIGVEAQRCEQVSEEILGDRLARLRALLLLYWFT
jgi:hypothetical protein